MTIEIAKLRRLLLDDLVAFEQIEQLCESTAPNKDEIAQHARDGIKAIEAALAHGPDNPNGTESK